MDIFLEFRGEVRTGGIDLGVINIQFEFKAIRLKSLERLHIYKQKKRERSRTESRGT